MEITRISQIPQVATKATKSTPTNDAARTQIARAQARQAESQRQVGEALAKAILADSNIEPVDFSKFSVSLDIHRETGRIVAEIRNKNTGEVLQKIPSDSVLRGAVMLDQVLGTILDTPV